jgi:hypothetical protein
VTRREANYATLALNGFASDQLGGRAPGQRSVRQQRRVIVPKNEGVRISRVLGPTRAIVSRAEITLRVMLRSALAA